MNIGENIRKFRKAANLTQKELAQRCGYATGTIQQYELKKREPRLEQIRTIADVLKIPISSLLDGVDYSTIHSDFEVEYSRLEKRRLQYLQSLGYKIDLHPDCSFDIYCEGYKYSIPHKSPQEYYDLICEVIDSAASNILEQIIAEYKATEQDE